MNSSGGIEMASRWILLGTLSITFGFVACGGSDQSTGGGPATGGASGTGTGGGPATGGTGGTGQSTGGGPATGGASGTGAGGGPATGGTSGTGGGAPQCGGITGAQCPGRA